MDQEYSYDTLIVVTTQKGGIMPIYEGMEYMKSSETADHIICRCTKQKEDDCKAKIQISKSNSYTLMKVPSCEHTHMGKCYK